MLRRSYIRESSLGTHTETVRGQVGVFMLDGKGHEGQ